MKKSVTLIELLIAIALFSVIILGAFSFHLASDRFLRSSERKSEILNELNLILDHLSKYVGSATGDINNRGIVIPNSTTLRIRTDSGIAGNYTDDIWVEYSFDASNTHQLNFCSNSPSAGNCSADWETLSLRVVRDDPDFSFDQTGLDANQISVLNLKLRFDITKAIDFAINPEVSAPSSFTLTSSRHSVN